MLSRVAERLYWMGRYLERAENTARLISVYSNVLLDMPKSARLAWDSLITITGSTEAFHDQYQRSEERNVVKFFIADVNNGVSVSSSLAAARSNARTTREVLPASVFELINDLFLYATNESSTALARRGREAFLRRTVDSCQTISGALLGTMSHDEGYQLLRCGQYLERADMTSRLIDVGSATVLAASQDGDSEAYAGIIWLSVLRSISALQMFRRKVPDRIQSEDVVEFLVNDSEFPRAIRHCLRKVAIGMEQLPRSEMPLGLALSAERRLHEAGLAELVDQGLLEFLDRVQLDLNEIDTALESTWFRIPEVTGAARTPVAESKAPAKSSTKSPARPASGAAKSSPGKSSSKQSQAQRTR